MMRFPDCGHEPLGLYPIVDSAEWLKRLLPLGVKTIQLRIKQQSDDVLAQEIKQAINLARQFSARLFVNDYWQLAIACQAYGVHLGQEDLSAAEVWQINQAGLRLGISAHNDDELTRAVNFSPSYIAWGPIYKTLSKEMSFKPQGVSKLGEVVRRLACPVVAIGGIGLNCIEEVLATGVDGVAMISAITQAKDPLGVTRALLRACSKSLEILNRL